jgi:hypothetical protein
MKAKALWLRAPQTRRERGGRIDPPLGATVLKTKNFSAWEKLIGAARGIRTPDPLITNEVLYQLSYCGPDPTGITHGAMSAPGVAGS